MLEQRPFWIRKKYFNEVYIKAQFRKRSSICLTHSGFAHKGTLLKQSIFQVNSDLADSDLSFWTRKFKCWEGSDPGMMHLIHNKSESKDNRRYMLHKLNKL